MKPGLNPDTGYLTIVLYAYERHRTAHVHELVGYRVAQLVYWVFSLSECLFAICFVLKALGANPAAGFAQFI